MPSKQEEWQLYLNTDIFKLWEFWAGEVVQWLKHLHHKPKDQNFNPWTHENIYGGEYCPPVILAF